MNEAMSDPAVQARMKKTARLAGILYAVLALAMFPEIIRNTLIVAGDAAKTAANIMSNELLFRAGIFGDLVFQTSFVFLGLTLYRLFRNTHKNVGRTMVALILVSVPVAMLNALNPLAALALFGQNDNDQGMFFIGMFKNGVLIAEIFWGLWLFPLGWLSYKSGFIPKLLGILLMAGCFGYLTDSFLGLVFPLYRSLSAPLITVAAIAELAMVFYLLVFGIRIKRSPQ